MLSKSGLWLILLFAGIALFGVVAFLPLADAWKERLSVTGFAMVMAGFVIKAISAHRTRTPKRRGRDRNNRFDAGDFGSD